MGIARLHPHLQHALVHDLGWRSLRPVQELAIDVVLDGCNTVVLAPTAGGKTEAAIFPILSRILSEELAPVAALYLCPIRALLNHQEERLRSYARMVGLDVFKWHGDVSDARRQTFRNTPAHVLMTTPESLEVMMISARTDARALFAGLSMVVIDEVHAFAGDDRGAHLVALLERLSAFSQRDIQRIGLSATVGNPLLIGEWLQGASQRPFRLVDPPKAQVPRDLRVEYAEDLGIAAAGITRLARGKKTLVFVESRARAERVAQALAGSSVEVFIHHSSVSRADRALAEAQFAQGSNTAIVCTSTMELGIDVGDLDQVIQVDAPGSVASFLQRLGRTGRRPGTRARCTFFCLSPETLLQSVALLRRAEEGFVEEVHPAFAAVHVLAHQIMALTLQEGGISRHRVFSWLDAAYPFVGVRPERLQQLIDTMLERDILHEADGLLSLGLRGERLYGRRNFFELYAVFTAPSLLRVQHGKEEVGYVQALFIALQGQSGPLCIRLAGRAWEVAKTDWSRGVLHVVPAEHGRVPSWLGQPGALSTDLCQAMMEVLVDERPEEAAWLSEAAREELATLRSGYEGLLAPGTAPIEDLPEGVTWHTFAGGRVNRLLAAGLEKTTGAKWTAGNLSLRCRELPVTAVREAVGGLAQLDWEVTAGGAARDMARGTVSKFQPCLPPDAEDRLLAERLLDLPGTLRFLGNVAVGGVPIAARPENVGARPRLRDDEAPVLHLELPPRQGPVPSNTLIEWVDTPAGLRAVAAKLAVEAVVGLDVETTLDFGTLCLIQVATKERTWLIDPFAVGDLAPLAGPFRAASPVKVIHHAAFERRVLAAVGIGLGGVYDTLEVSRHVRGPQALGGHSLAMVCERELGHSLDKTEQTSNWQRRPLTRDQLRYAALDAEVLLRLHAHFAGLEPQPSLW